MHYYIYCNQKTVSRHHREAICEFEKRLSAYCNTTLLFSSSLSFSKEILHGNHYFLQNRPGISTYSSEEFAQVIDALQQNGTSNIHILIGYTDEECYAASNYSIDIPHFSITRSQFSKETLTLLFYEQLYRGYTILHGKTYHK